MTHLEKVATPPRQELAGPGHWEGCLNVLGWIYFFQAIGGAKQVGSVLGPVYVFMNPQRKFKTAGIDNIDNEVVHQAMRKLSVYSVFSIQAIVS